MSSFSFHHSIEYFCKNISFFNVGFMNVHLPPEKKRILIADDMEFNQLFIKQILEGEQFDLMFVSNGEEAVRIFEKENFDLVLLDVEMPVMDGFEALDKIKQINPAIPVLAITGHKKEQKLDEVEQKDFAGLIQKPFKKESLLARVQAFLSKEGGASVTNHQSINHEQEENEKVYDLSVLDEFSSGDNTFKQEMLGYFVNNAPQMLQNMQDAINLEDWKALHGLAHKFGSELGFLGLTEIAQLGDEIEEQALLAKDKSLIKNLFSNFEKKLTFAIQQLKKDFKLS
jgi:CheY-like chemotaxis protein